jgi:hypothetical protein
MFGVVCASGSTVDVVTLKLQAVTHPPLAISPHPVGPSASSAASSLAKNHAMHYTSVLSVRPSHLSVHASACISAALTGRFFVKFCSVDFMKICLENPRLVKISQKCLSVCMKTQMRCVAVGDVKSLQQRYLIIHVIRLLGRPRRYKDCANASEYARCR